jgi:hypothetical protein
VVEPFGADVLLSLTYRWDDGCNTTTSCGLPQKLSGLWRAIARLALEPMVPISTLLRTMETLPHWPAILLAFNRTRHSKGHPLMHVPGRYAEYLNHRTALYNTCVRDPSWRDTAGESGFVQQTPSKNTRVARSPYRCDGLPTVRRLDSH